MQWTSRAAQGLFGFSIGFLNLPQTSSAEFASKETASSMAGRASGGSGVCLRQFSALEVYKLFRRQAVIQEVHGKLSSLKELVLEAGGFCN